MADHGILCGTMAGRGSGGGAPEAILLSKPAGHLCSIVMDVACPFLGDTCHTLRSILVWVSIRAWTSDASPCSVCKAFQPVNLLAN